MEEIKMNEYHANSVEHESLQKTNEFLRGSKLIGNINITCDLELSGDVEGNITSEKKCNIVIKGNCKGSIKTREGNVDIEGQMSNGDIIAGGDIKITGKFNGGKLEAKGKIYIDGEFNGKLQSNEVEIGPNAHGNGEIFYKENISIAKGAKVKVHIDKFQGAYEEVKKSAEKKVIDFEFPIQKNRKIK
jgi:cytoskeletal protein CcmA (bactofilin family)